MCTSSLGRTRLADALLGPLTCVRRTKEIMRNWVYKNLFALGSGTFSASMLRGGVPAGKPIPKRSKAKNAMYPYELGKIKWMDEWTDQMTVARNTKDNTM